MIPNEVAHYQPTDSWVPVLPAIGELAQRIGQTTFVPRGLRGNIPAVAACILTGREMNLGPMASLRGIDIIDGRPSLTAQMVAARILAAGHRIEWAVTDQRATVRITRGDGLSSAEATWSMADAQRAGLAGKAVWRNYPRHMLRARALSEAASMACPDVVLGLDVADPHTDQAPPEQTATTVRIAPHDDVVSVVSDRQFQPEIEEKPDEKTLEKPSENPPENLQETRTPAGPAEPHETLVTQAQLRKMNAQLTELQNATGHRLDRDERRALIATLAGAEGLDSAKNLTRDQAHTAIDALDRVIADTQPQEGPPAETHP